MKKLLFLSVVLLFSMTFFAQDALKVVIPQDEVVIPHRTRDSIFVLDSSIKSNFNTDWYFLEKHVSKDFDNSGRVTEDEIYGFDATNSTWKPMYKTYFTYFPTDEIRSYLIFPYNTNIMNWESDTGMYYNILELAHPYMQEPVYQDKFISMNWDNVNNVYTGGNKVLITLHNNDYYENLDFYSWDLSNTSFNLAENKAFTYNSDDYLEMFVHKRADSTGTLQNYKQYFYVVANNLMMQKIYQNWTGTTWVNYQKYTYTYDANNNNTSYTKYNWSGSDWVPSYKYEYTYDSNNNELSETEYDWDSGAADWVPSDKTIYQYNTNNDLLATIYQIWNSSTDSFVNDYKDEWEYDANFNKIKYLGLDWNTTNSVWDSVYRDIYEYNSENLLISHLYQEYNSGWKNTDIAKYTYDANMNKTQYLYQVWDSGASAWKNSSKTDYYYSAKEVESTQEVVAQTNVKVYPNPASDMLFVKSDNKLDKVILLSSTGQVVSGSANLQGQTTIINLSNLSSGVYMVQIIDKKGNISTRNIIKK